MERTNKIAFLTLASGKSKRLPNKNMIDVNGKPLIKYTTDFVKALLFRDKIKAEYYIITDDKKIKSFAMSEGINYLIEPEHDKTRDHDNGMRLMRWIHEQIGAQMYFIFSPTTPLRNKGSMYHIIQSCITGIHDSATIICNKDRNTYILKGTMFFYRSIQLYYDDLIDTETKLYLEDKFDYLDIDTKEDLELFKRCCK